MAPGVSRFLFLRGLPRTGTNTRLGRAGRAGHESLFPRAFLSGNPGYKIVARNSFAGRAFPEIFRAEFPAFLDHTGGSIWLRKVS